MTDHDHNLMGRNWPTITKRPVTDEPPALEVGSGIDFTTMGILRRTPVMDLPPQLQDFILQNQDRSDLCQVIVTGVYGYQISEEN